VPNGPVRVGYLEEKNFTIGGAWGYKAGVPVMGFGTVMNILVNSWVRNMTCLLNVGPTARGRCPPRRPTWCARWVRS
jgi:alpha-L-fucosidase